MKRLALIAWMLISLGSYGQSIRPVAMPLYQVEQKLVELDEVLQSRAFRLANDHFTCRAITTFHCIAPVQSTPIILHGGLPAQFGDSISSSAWYLSLNTYERARMIRMRDWRTSYLYYQPFCRSIMAAMYLPRISNSKLTESPTFNV